VSPGFGGTTVYNFYTINTDGKPEVQFKRLKRLVGERGFEPPTPSSRTRYFALRQRRSEKRSDLYGQNRRLSARGRFHNGIS
jgi:hypothetical protein